MKNFKLAQDNSFKLNETSLQVRSLKFETL